MYLVLALTSPKGRGKEQKRKNFGSIESIKPVRIVGEIEKR